MTDKEIVFTEEDAKGAQTLVLELLYLDRAARAMGSPGIVAAVQTAIRLQFGYDVRPEPLPTEPDAVDAPAEVVAPAV